MVERSLLETLCYHAAIGTVWPIHSTVGRDTLTARIEDNWLGPLARTALSVKAGTTSKLKAAGQELQHMHLSESHVTLLKAELNTSPCRGNANEPPI